MGNIRGGDVRRRFSKCSVRQYPRHLIALELSTKEVPTPVPISELANPDADQHIS